MLRTFLNDVCENLKSFEAIRKASTFSVSDHNSKNNRNLNKSFDRIPSKVTTLYFEALNVKIRTFYRRFQREKKNTSL